MQCNAMQCNAMQCNAMQCNAMQCNAMQCNAMQCNAMQNNAMQCNGTDGTALSQLRSSQTRDRGSGQCRAGRGYLLSPNAVAAAPAARPAASEVVRGLLV